jgi:transposase-like protein
MPAIEGTPIVKQPAVRAALAPVDESSSATERDGSAPSAEAAQAELDAFEQGPWGRKFPTVVAAWRRAWDRVIPFFAFPPAVRRVIYTTNAIESINARLRKIIKSRGHFPSDDAATKLIWLALRNITADWGRAAHNWKEAMNQFAILYADRFTHAARTLG